MSTTAAALPPSSLTSGFFQSLPLIPPQYSAPPHSPASRLKTADNYSDDPILPRVLALYLPTSIPDHISTHLHTFSRLVLQQSTLNHTVDADTNPPTLHPLTTFGTPNLTDPLHTSPGWKALKRIQTANGVVGHGYPQTSQPTTKHAAPYNRRIHQFATLHLWSGSAAVTTCPTAMTDGAAVLLRQQLASPDLDTKSRKVFSDAYDRLISLDPEYAWTSGQWMTERSGGSDVRGTETVARRMSLEEIDEERKKDMDRDSIGNELGEWRVDGFKWFSSATDADMCALLAKTDEGISAFFAPLRRRVPVVQGSVSVVSGGEREYTTQMNGVYLSRLKNKLGTKAVPTAELEIRGDQDDFQSFECYEDLDGEWECLWLESGFGDFKSIYESEECERGMLLSENKQHLKWMADETVVYRAMTSLYMFGVALLGHSEDGSGSRGTKAMELGLLPQSKMQTEKLLRLLTPLMKMCCSLASVAGLRACMESLGGVGYCENNEDGGILNIARLFRDANVNPIWEGTGSVLAEDLLRALRAGKKGVKEEWQSTFGMWFEEVMKTLERLSPSFQGMLVVVKERYEKVRKLVETKTEEELLWQGRVVIYHFEAIVCAVLLMADACVDRDGVAIAVAERWVRAKVREGPLDEVVNWRKDAEIDRRIYLGSHDDKRGSLSKL